MKQMGGILFISLVVMVTTIQACPEGWISWGSSCYLRSSKERNYADALAFCHKHQSTLVVINSEAENKFIYDTFVSKPKFQKHYIGVKRIAKGCETFVTSEGKLLTYTNWDTGEPNNLGSIENCVEMRDKGFWNDIPCSKKLPLICEAGITCESKPCKNGGKCVDQPDNYVDRYKCICQPPFYGKNCEQVRGCEKGWIAFGEYCYREFPGPRPWSNARLICEGERADLAVIRSDEENEFLLKTFTKHDFWVGIKECLCGKKCTVDYGKVTYTNWAKCQPMELGDDEKGCVMFEKNTGKWYNMDCKEKHYTVCRKALKPRI